VLSSSSADSFMLSQDLKRRICTWSQQIQVRVVGL
jgi:hypothetical protein